MAGGRPGGATRERLLTAAERLFAEQGVNGVSLRQVAVAAGCGNHSAPQYHFGDRDGLVRAIFERRMTPINRRRLDLLAAEPSRGSAVASLARALVEPLALGLSDEPGGSFYARFVAATMADPRMLAQKGDAPYLEGLRRVSAGLARALPECPDAALGERLGFAHTLCVEVFAQFERARDAGLLPPGRTLRRVTEALCLSVAGLIDPHPATGVLGPDAPADPPTSQRPEEDAA